MKQTNRGEGNNITLMYSGFIPVRSQDRFFFFCMYFFLSGVMKCS